MCSSKVGQRPFLIAQWRVHLGFQSYIACLKLSVCLSLSLLRLLRQPQFFSLYIYVVKGLYM